MATKKTPNPKTGDAPASIKLTAPYGFIDDNDQHRYWQPGQVVINPDEIALLTERQAPIEAVGNTESEE